MLASSRHEIGTAAAAHARGQIHVTSELDIPGFAMKFGRDEEIFGEGESADFVYKVHSGVVRTYRLLDDGRRQISAFHFPGDVFGIEVDDEHSTTAEAVIESEVGLVKRSALNRSTENDAGAARALWALTSRHLQRMQRHLVLLGRKTALERVASFLLSLAKQEGEQTVAIPMSRMDIADYLGLTIETVSRTLSQLEREAAIKLPNCRQIVLRDRGRLDQLAA
jgi:CRP/FNR family transcriptional regulator, nitrogen fixation regulation protein